MKLSNPDSAVECEPLCLEELDHLIGACPERNRRSRNDIGGKLPCSTAESGFKTPSIVLSYPMQAFSGNMETKRSSRLNRVYHTIADNIQHFIIDKKHISRDGPKFFQFLFLVSGIRHETRFTSQTKIRWRRV